jgi:hypothetical protein
MRAALALCAALCALGAIASASASALRPEYGVWPNKITQFNGGEVKLETVGGKVSVACKSSQNSAEATTFKSGTAQLSFRECKSSLGTACKSTNTSVSGEIKSSNMKWTLVYLSKATHEVATLFQGGESGSAWTTFGCGLGSNSTLRGSALAKMTPVNTKSASFTLTLQGSHGKQEFTQYETESGEKATAALELNWGSGGLEAADVNVAGLTQVWETENEILA